MIKPNFLIAGAQKCGTSSLSRMLAQHPEIHIDNKEINFFNMYYSKGMEWYSKYFINGKVNGEKTPDYIYFKECLQRIKKTIPDVKFIILLRNPTDRAISYYQRSKELKRRTFKQAIDKGMKLINQNITLKNYNSFWFIHRGIYHLQIEEFLKIFKKEQLHIIFTKDFLTHTKEVMEKVYSFLNINYYDIQRLIINKSVKIKIDMKSRIRLEKFYEPYNEKLFNLLGYSYEW